MINEEKRYVFVKLLTGYGKTQSYTIVNVYLKECFDVLCDRRKGEPKRLFTKVQREEILETVKTKISKDFGYSKENWAISILGDWIQRIHGVIYKFKTSLYLVFKQARFTYHKLKLGRVYDKHNEEEVSRWKEEKKPKVKEFWSDMDTVILCGDVMVLTTETTIRKSGFLEENFQR